MKLHRFEKALRIAFDSHSGQFDKAGFPYVLHPIRVAEAVETEDEKIVAVLHDTVEDTDVTFLEIQEEFDIEIAQAVMAITKMEKLGDKFETYRDYLDRVRENSLALRVKLADMFDNSRPERLTHLPVAKQIRLAAKYARGRHYLLTGEWYESEDLDRVIKAGNKK